MKILSPSASSPWFSDMVYVLRRIYIAQSELRYSSEIYELDDSASGYQICLSLGFQTSLFLNSKQLQPYWLALLSSV